MRTDRAYIAGLGTTGVLVGAAILLLAVVGALVAFRGWPGNDVSDDIGNLTVGESRRTVAVEGPARIAAEAAPAAGAVAETAAAGSAAAAAPRTRPAAPAARLAPERAVPPGSGLTFSDDPGGGGSAPPATGGRPAGSLVPGAPDAAELQRIALGLGDATQEVGDGLGETVGELNPPLGGTLIDTGRLLADIIRALAAVPRAAP